MKKLAAISTAVSICATFLGSLHPASANPISWKLIDRSRDGTPVFYDENLVNVTNGDIYLTHVSAEGKKVAFALMCSRATYTYSTSLNSRDFANPPLPIRPGTFAAKLHKIFCPAGTQPIQRIQPILNGENIRQLQELQNLNFLNLHPNGR